MSSEQIQRLREMADKRAITLAEMEEDECQFNAGSRAHARFLEEKLKTADEFTALTAAADIADAYRWRPVGELTEEDRKDYRRIIWGCRFPDGGLDTYSGIDKKDAVYLGYTHFLRLPKLEAL